MNKMTCVKAFWTVSLVSLSIFTKQLQLQSNEPLSYCDSNRNRTEDVIFHFYKPRVHYIMNKINSHPIAEDFYQKYSSFIDNIGARPSGSPILEKAIDYMINLTLDCGINDIETESVTVPYWKRGYESLKMILPSMRNMTILGLGPSVPTPLNGITAEVIVVNSFSDLDVINQNVLGKIVLFNAHFTIYEETISYRVNSAVAAAKRGAVAVLVRSITPFSLYTPHTGYLNYENGVRKIPAAAITLEDADFFQRAYNRGERIVVNLKMFNDFSLQKSRNVIIDLKGEETPEKMIVVSGHIDSWDVGTGAIDDGGGMMISWFVPVILKHLNFRPKRTIRCILWTSEEPGLIGAASYLKYHSNELHKIEFIMESDSGTFEPLGLEVAGSANIRCLMESILKLFTPIDKLRYANTTGSDITLFVNSGIPGASLLNRNDRYFWFHHTQADTLTAQNKINVVKCAAFWAAVSYVIADLPFPIPL